MREPNGATTPSPTPGAAPEPVAAPTGEPVVIPHMAPPNTATPTSESTAPPPRLPLGPPVPPPPAPAVKSGGAGSLEARFDDVLMAAQVMQGSEQFVRALLGRVAQVPADPDLLASAILVPESSVRVAAAYEPLVDPLRGLPASAANLGAMTLSLFAAEKAYRATEGLVDDAIENAQVAAGFVIGAVLQNIAVNLAVGVVLVGGAVVVVGTAADFGLALISEVTAEPTSMLGMGGPIIAAERAFENVRGDWVKNLGHLKNAQQAAQPWLNQMAGQAITFVGDELPGALFEHPGTTQATVNMTRGFLNSLAVGPTGGIARQYGIDLQYSSSFEGMVQNLIANAQQFGYLQDGTPVVTQKEGTKPYESEADSTPKGDFQDLMLNMSNLGRTGDENGHKIDQTGLVQVVQVGPSDSNIWRINISGTQGWDLKPGENPKDLATNLVLMARMGSTQAEGVRQGFEDVLRKAGVPESEWKNQKVLIDGHSQGGIVAGYLASDPEFNGRFTVDAVVTAGSPIARMPIPHNVAVLSMENHVDPVPHLDGRDNPARDNWLTFDQDVNQGYKDVEPGDPFSAHGSGNYAQTAAGVYDQIDETMKATLAPHLGNGTAYEFSVLREAKN